MGPESKDEEIVVSYLLGELPETEQATIELRFLKDPQYREMMLGVEDDLVDAYLAAELTDAERALIEQHLATSPQLRSKVQTARGLQMLLAEPPVLLRAETANDARDNWWKSLAGLLTTPRQRPQFSRGLALAVAIVFAALIGWWVLAGRRRPAPPDSLTTRQPSPEQQNSNQSPATQPAHGPLTAPPQNEDRDEERRRAQQAATHVRKPPASQFTASFFLSPGSLREAGEAGRLSVSHDVSQVRLHLYLPEGVGAPSYRAQLRTAGGRLLWSRERLTPKASPAGEIITVQIPTGLLTTGDYQLSLSPANQTTTLSLSGISLYDFSILRN